MYKAQYNSALAMQSHSLSIWFKIENHSDQLWKTTWS